jgi:Uma2 family endonuclease
MAQTALRSEEFFPEEVPEDEYYYGHRTVISYDEKGKVFFTRRPLTLKDFLNPEEGDVLMQGNVHTDDVGRLASIFRYHLKNRRNITVYTDMKMRWGIPDLDEPAPDISILKNVKDPDRPRGSFYVPDEGTRPFFVLEVVSPRYRRADTEDKPEIYRKAGISEYMIVDPGLEKGAKNYSIKGYRLIGNRYREIVPDKEGRYLSLTAGVYLKVSGSGDRIGVFDAVTHEEILSAEERAEEAEALAEEAVSAREEAEARAEQERILKEQEKARAEQERILKEQERILKEREKARADSAEEELRRLRAKLAGLGITE